MKYFSNIRNKNSLKFIYFSLFITNFKYTAYANNTISYLNSNIIANQKCSLDSANIVSKLITLNDTEFINHIGNMQAICISKINLASPHELDSLISTKNMLNIANAALLEVEKIQFEHSEKLRNYAIYLNTAYFLRSKNSYYFSDNDNKNIKEIIAKITHTYAINIYNQNVSNKLTILSKEIFNLINSSQCFEEALSLIEYITKYSKHISNKNTNPLYEAILPIQNALSSTHNAGGIYFKLNEKSNNNIDNFIVINSENIVKNIIKIINEDETILDNFLYRNYIRELGNFLRYKHHKDEIILVLKNLIKKTKMSYINGHNEPSPFWIEAVAALENNKIVNSLNCHEFIDSENINICDAKSNLSNIIFPNKFKFDEGNIIIYTSLSKDEVIKQYLAMKEVEALYNRTIQTFKPVPNDPNKRLQVFIYKTYEEYMKYKSYLNNLNNKDDSGIYLESIGSFFTYAGGNNFEQRIRHEFVHYLNGRFLVQGIHGDTSTFDKKWSRMTWFEEGSAEFFSGASQYNNFITIKNKINDIDVNNIRPIKEIVNSNYETLPNNVLYNQSYALVSYLYYKKPLFFSEIIKTIKKNNYEEFDNIIEQILSFDNDYINYINEMKNEKQHTENILNNINEFNFFSADEVNIIKLKLMNQNLKISNCEIVASSEFGNAQARFRCSGKLNNESYEYMNYKLNKELKKLTKKDKKFNYTNCSFGDQLLYCEGPLQNAKFDQISISRKKQIKNSLIEQREQTFKGVNEHYYFFTGSILSDNLFSSHRRIAAKDYTYSILNNTNIGFLHVNKNGELTYKNENQTPDDFNKTTGTVKVTDKVNSKITNDENYNINVNIFKFKEIDERMFVNKIYLNKYNSISQMIYRNEYSTDPNNKDNFRIFTDDFRTRVVNDFDFQIIEKPESAIAEINNRYMLSYFNPNKVQGKDDIIKVKVRKHNQETAIITIHALDESQKPLNPVLNDSNKATIETIPITIKTQNGNTTGYVYSEIEHLLEANTHYNYSIVEFPKCKDGFRLEDYGAFVYYSNGYCDVKNKDEATILVTKVTNNNISPIFNIKITFDIK